MQTAGRDKAPSNHMLLGRAILRRERMATIDADLTKEARWLSLRSQI